MCVYVCARVLAWAMWRPEADINVFLNCHPLYYFFGSKVSPLSWSLSNSLSWLAGQSQDLLLFISLALGHKVPATGLNFYMDSGDQTYALRLVWQALYWPCPPPVPSLESLIGDTPVCEQKWTNSEFPWLCGPNLSQSLIFPLNLLATRAHCFPCLLKIVWVWLFSLEPERIVTNTNNRGCIWLWRSILLIAANMQ